MNATWLSDGTRLYNLENVDVVKMVTMKSMDRGIAFGVVDPDKRMITYSSGVLPVEGYHARIVIKRVSRLLGHNFILVKGKNGANWYNKKSIKIIEFVPKSGTIMMTIHLVGGVKVDAKTFKSPAEVNTYLFEYFGNEVRNEEIMALETAKEKSILSLLSI